MNQKVGIVTLYGYLNYGNRYQNYAVQEILKQYGYDVKTLVVYDNIKPAAKTALCCVKMLFGNIEAKRYLLIRRFSKKHIPTHLILNKDKKIPNKVSKEYSYFVSGSDQVWNPFIRPRERDNFFLKFADKSQRLCLSPSFGIGKLGDEFKAEFFEGINGFPLLSCREQSGVDIIKNLVDRECALLIDPTLALQAEQWEKLFADIQIHRPKRYLLVAMLGNISDEKREYMESICKTHNLKRVDIFKDAYSPEQVLYLIAHASVVCTDSFHFTAFSINFNTPFIVFEREDNKVNSNMYSRLASLLKTFDLEDRKYHAICQENEICCDYERANYQLTKEREKFKEYINACFLTERNE